MDVLLAAQEDAAQHHAHYPVRVRTGVGQCQRRAPRTTKQHPLVDPKVLTQRFHVGHQIGGGVVLQTAVRGAATAALVKGDNSIDRRIEEAATQGIAPGSGPAMDEYHRQAIGLTAFIGIENMGRGDRQFVAGVGLISGYNSCMMAP